jgi:hypothetical protein
MRNDFTNLPNQGERRIFVKKTFAVFPVVAVLVLTCISLAVGGNNTTTKLEILYVDYIEELISKCESKAARYDSKCQNIRRASSLYSLKAAFYRSHKVALVNDMIEEDVGTKAHRIHYYLNKRFFDTLREALKSVDTQNLL